VRVVRVSTRLVHQNLDLALRKHEVFVADITVANDALARRERLLVHSISECLVLLGVQVLCQEALSEQILDTLCIFGQLLEDWCDKLGHIVQLNVLLED
jgi:hypothetical protein